MSAFDDAVRAKLVEALDAACREQAEGRGRFAVSADGQPPIEVQKFGAPVLMSDDTLMDEGLIPDTRPPVHIPWRRRVRWRIREKVDGLRLRVGARIAGVDPAHWEELYG